MDAGDPFGLLSLSYFDHLCRKFQQETGLPGKQARAKRKTAGPFWQPGCFMQRLSISQS
jgi:hypothetical protein